jgi:hypothetical protein
VGVFLNLPALQENKKNTEKKNNDKKKKGET